MNLPRVYCPDLERGDRTLSEPESHHLAAVLRVQVGANVVAFNGEGRTGPAEVVRVHRGAVIIRIADTQQEPFDSPHRVTLAVAMSRQHRQGYLIEKCTELGVAEIWPILAERSVAKTGDFGIHKLRRRAVEAAKQSRRAWVPSIEAAQNFGDALRRAPEFKAACLTHVSNQAPLLLGVLSKLSSGSSVLIFVGPEGGWSQSELERAHQTQITVTSLGRNVLRTETAALCVCAAALMCDAQTEAR